MSSDCTRLGSSTEPTCLLHLRATSHQTPQELLLNTCYCSARNTSRWSRTFHIDCIYNFPLPFFFLQDDCLQPLRDSHRFFLLNAAWVSRTVPFSQQSLRNYQNVQWAIRTTYKQKETVLEKERNIDVVPDFDHCILINIVKEGALGT